LMQTWEYHVLMLAARASDEQRDELVNKLGAASWELVAIVALSLSASPAEAGTTTHERWVFKRPALIEGNMPSQATMTAVALEDPPRSGGDSDNVPGAARPNMSPRQRAAGGSHRRDER
jgi:hypothetical protein